MFQEKILRLGRRIFSLGAKRLSSSFLGRFSLLRSFLLLCYFSFLLCHFINL